MDRSPRWWLLALALLVALAALAGLLGRGRDRGVEDPRPVGVAAPAPDPGPPRALAPAEPVENAPEPVGTSRTRTAPAAPPATDRAVGTETILVRVLQEPTRAPVAGAAVRLLSDDPTLPAVRTAADGTCRVRPTDAEPWIGFHVQAPGFPHLVTGLERRPELELVLPRSATLFGHVRAADTGAGVAGAVLRVERNRCACPEDPVRADEGGRYELPAVPVEEEWTTIAVQAEGFPAVRRSFELRTEEERVAQDFVLERGIEITGRVLDSRSGAGVSGALVEDVEADAAGRFRSWISAPDGTDPLVVHVSAPGYCRVAAPFARAALGTGAPLELRIPRAAVVEGRVLSRDGPPIAGAFVMADREAQLTVREGSASALPVGTTIAPEGPLRTARTDADGRFRLEGIVAEDRETEIGVGAEGYEDRYETLPRAPAPGETVTMELVLAPQAPAHGALVSLTLVQGGERLYLSGTLRWTGATRRGEVRLRSGGCGVEVEPGEVRFELALEGSPAGDTRSFALTLAPGERREHELDLHLPSARVAGRVTFPDGAPLAGATLEARADREDGAPRLRVSGKSDADGRFVLELPDAWTYRVAARLDHEESAREGVRPGTEDLAFVLSRPGSLFYRLVDARTGAALAPADFEFAWRRSGEAEFHAWGVGLFAQPGLDGWYPDRLPAGILDLRVRQKGLPQIGLTLEAQPIPAEGEPPRFELRIERP